MTGLVAIHTRTNCGAWVLVDREGVAYGLDPALAASLSTVDVSAGAAGARPRRPLLRSAFWGGSPDRVRRIVALSLVRDGRMVAGVEGGGVLWLTRLEAATIARIVGELPAAA